MKTKNLLVCLLAALSLALAGNAIAKGNGGNNGKGGWGGKGGWSRCERRYHEHRHCHKKESSPSVVEGKHHPRKFENTKGEDEPPIDTQYLKEKGRNGE
jgi:hypothetical protein